MEERNAYSEKRLRRIVLLLKAKCGDYFHFDELTVRMTALEYEDGARVVAEGFERLRWRRLRRDSSLRSE